jgi:pyrroloquinoline quinone biosynthesis protein A
MDNTMETNRGSPLSRPALQLINVIGHPMFANQNRPTFRAHLERAWMLLLQLRDCTQHFLANSRKGVSQSRYQPQGGNMTWTTPAYTELRLGFEITMYIANR